MVLGLDQEALEAQVGRGLHHVEHVVVELAAVLGEQDGGRRLLLTGVGLGCGGDVEEHVLVLAQRLEGRDQHVCLRVCFAIIDR